MADRDPRGHWRQWPHVAKTARKSAPVSAGGVNVRRLVLHRQLPVEEEKEPNNECGNPFCRQILVNRYARFCEDKPMCQRYRALKLQCLANAQAEEDEEDTRPLAIVLKRRKRREEEKKEKKDAAFAIPRRKKPEGPSSSAAAVGKRRLNLNATAAAAVSNEERSSSNSSSPRQKEKLLRKQKKREMEKQLEEEKEKEEKRQRKRVKRAREIAETKAATSTVQGSSASSAEEFGLVTERVKKRTLPRDPRVRQPPQTSSDAETRTAVDVSRVKRRKLSRCVSADDVLSRSASSSPITAASVSSAATTANTNWKIPRAKPGRARTAAQAIRNMNLEPVPLGVANQANFTGGGRYVQNGNRSAVQSLRPSDPRLRPPSMAKFSAPAVFAPSSAVPSNATSRPLQTTQPMVPPQTQPPLPPLPPQTTSLAPPVPRPTGPAVTPPVKTPAVASNANPPTTTATGVPAITRISTSDYRKNRKGDHERRPLGERTDGRPSRSSSLERSSSLTDGLASGLPPASAYPTSRPGYHRSDSAPLPSSRESRPAVDPRRQYTEVDVRHQRPYLDMEGSRVEYRDRSEARGEPAVNERSTSGQWEARTFPPPRDHYPSRQQELPSVGTTNSGYDYAVDTHFSPASSPAEQPHWRGTSHVESSPPQRAPSPRRSEQRVNNDVRRDSDHDDVDADAPTFSYHEHFLARLLSIFIHKLPQSLEAVFNVTKKPRKMHWYITYVERIQRLCKPFDLQIKFDGLKAVVTVRGREWLTLQGTSTVTLYMDVIKSLRAEAMTWLRLYEEMEAALAHYRGIYGSQTNESYAFLRAWNELKKPGNYISLSRQANYFCGARLHHWNFVVGTVEIGSGSHEEKREAFRLATVSALEFLLSVGRGVRRPSQGSAVKRERILEGDRLSARGSHRSSSRESSASNRVRESPANEKANGVSAESSPSVGPPSSVESPSPAAGPSSVELPTEQPSADNPEPSAEAPSTTEPQSSAEASSFPVAVERTEKSIAAITPTINSSTSYEVAEAVEQSEEMSISDASDVSTLTPAGSPHVAMTTCANPSSSVPGSAAVPAASTTPAMASPPAPKAAVSTSTVTDEAPLLSTASVGSKAPTAKPATTAGVGLSAPAVGDFGSASSKGTPASQTKAPIPLRRCMMCEMIRMRKPDGERCLRCQQKDAPANGALNSSLGP